MKDQLHASKSLAQKELPVSSNGRFRFVLQDDGNFVLYGDDNRVIWSANCFGATKAIMQDDGNLGHVRWASSTIAAATQAQS